MNATTELLKILTAITAITAQMPTLIDYSKQIIDALRSRGTDEEVEAMIRQAEENNAEALRLIEEYEAKRNNGTASTETHV